MAKTADPTVIFAHNLSSLRKQQGWSQEVLAEKTNLSRQTVIKYEKGEAGPSISTVRKFAEVLGAPMEVFFKEDLQFEDLYHGFKIQDYSGTIKVNYREGEKIDLETSETVKRESLIKLKKLLELESIMDSKIKFRNPIRHIQNIDTREKAEEAALELRKKWGLHNNPFANVIGVLEREGIKVIEVNASPAFEGLSALYFETPVIVLNSAVNEITSKRFTTLHVLAHLVLQIREGLDYQKIERICDSFASMLILPKELLAMELGNARTKITMEELNLIKQKYGISIRAILVSAAFAKIISWSRYSELCLEIESSHAVITEYPLKEQALRFHQLLYRGVMENKLDQKKYDELVGNEIQFNELKAI
jgi:transcriptional regulator with XRE-family HTH domain